MNSMVVLGAQWGDLLEHARVSLASFWPLSFSEQPTLADQSELSGVEPHRSSYLNVRASPAFWSFDQLRISDPLAVCVSEKRVDPIAFLSIAAIVAPREFVEVAVNVLRADPMMDAEHLPLKVRPCTFQSVDVAEVVADVLADLWLTV